MLNRLKFFLITALPVLFGFFFIIPNADASTVYTIYAYGSGYIMVGILQSIASVVASGGFSLILKSVVLVGFVIIFLQMIITSFKVSPHRSLIKYFSAVLVIYSALLIPKVSVNVYDTVNNTTSNAVVVNNVPWGVGAIASYFSEFQYYMTTNIEQAFSTPNTIDLTNAGMGFALTSQNIVSGVQIDDPYLFQSFTKYVYNCVLPGISTGGLSSQALTQAGMSTTGTGNATNSLLSYMASYTDGAGANLITTEYSAPGGDGSPSGTTTTCGAQTSDIQTDFTNYATNEAGPQIAGALGMTYATFANQYGLVNNAIYNMSSNAMDEIIQMTAVNQFNQAMIQSANLAGVNPSQLAYGSALAQQNMSDSFSISGQMAGKYMPVVYGIFSALFLAFSLFLIILTALPIGLNYLKMYIEMLLFLAVWPTLMAVYNYIIDLIVQQQFGYLATQGYSINSAHSVNTFIATQLGWMGYLSWGVPMMAYALVTGSTYAMVGAISSMDSAGKQAASKAGAQAASGNVNLGNDSMKNYSADNKSMHNLSAMDVSTGNTNKNNYSSGNINKNSVSESIDHGKATAKGIYKPGTDMSNLNNESISEVASQMSSGTITEANPNGKGHEILNVANGKILSGTINNGLATSGLFQRKGKTFAGTKISRISPTTGKGGKPVFTQGTRGQNFNTENNINSSYSRFKKSLKGYENLTKELNKGEFGTYSLYKNGQTHENLDNFVNNSSTVDTSGTKHDLYDDQYNVGMTPGVLEGAMAYKGKGAGQFLSAGQKNMANYVLSGKAGQGYKENLINQGIGAFAAVKNTSQANSQDIKGQLEAFATLENKFYAGEGISFGVVEGDKLVIKGGAKGTATISYSELNQMKIDEFKESAYNSPAVQGAKTFTQLKSALTQSFNKTTPVENQLVKATAIKLKSMGINPVTSLTSGSSKAAETNKLLKEEADGKITPAQYRKDAEKIGEGNHNL